MLIEYLPRDSALVRAIHGDQAEWGLTEHLLATTVDQLTIANWLFVCANSAEGAEQPERPAPLPRPGIAEPEPESATPEQISAFFSSF